MKKSSFKFLEHPAELKICAWGKDLPELFINSAKGMMNYLYGNSLPMLKNRQTETITIIANDIESLLVDWLAEILWLSDTKKRVYLNFKVIEFGNGIIKAEIDSVKARAIDDIKAVTFSELSIIQKQDFWEATVVYDI